jgi:hypoxanthine phosphoribosyltransferase
VDTLHGDDPVRNERKAIVLTWHEIHHIVWRLALQIQEEGTPEVIVAVQRGGFIPGVLLSHMLGIRSLISFNIRRTSHDGISALKVPPVAGANVSFAEIANRDVLVVDDIAGSGMTLDEVRCTLHQCTPRRLRTLVCFVNRSNWDSSNRASPNTAINYVGKESTEWVVFPWERNPT